MSSRTVDIRFATTLVASVATLILSTTDVVAQPGKGKPPADQPVTAVIVGNPLSNSLGGIFGDGGSYSAVFNSSGEFYLNLQPSTSGGRWVNVSFADFREQGTCSPCKSYLLNGQVTLGHGGTGGYLRTNLVDEFDNEVSGGMANMPTGATMKARFLVTFQVSDPDSVSRKNPSGNIGFVLRYWPAYLHAAYVTVTRVDSSHWVIEAIDADGVASDSGLWNDAARLIRPDGLNVIYEDLFRVPFRIEVTRP